MVQANCIVTIWSLDDSRQDAPPTSFRLPLKPQARADLSLSPLLRKMGLEVSNKRGPDALTEPGGPATEPRKRFKVTPRRRVPGPVDLHSNGGGKAEHRGNSEPEEAAGKKAKKANGPLKIWSSRERAVKPPCREGAWGEGIQNWWEVSLQSGTPSEEEDVAVNQGEEAEGGVGGSSEEGSGVFLTAGLVGEEAPEDGGLDITEVEGAATHEKVHSTKALANDERPDKAYTTERAKKNGLANASSGKVFVTSPGDHFGPITAFHDPVNRTGVRVGSEWGSRMECRQWGVHMPPVAGISGQSGRGAQSVVISGGYEDDEDHGWYFIYTGSGGRDLSGNKRTSKEQSKEQVFTNFNLALKISCREGYPVRVVRSYKDRKSAFAPPCKPTIRYDGIYRVEKCWRKPGKQNALMCRFLFVRCDNEPPPWDSDGDADSPHRIVPEIAELNGACDVFERDGPAAWDWKEDEGCWGWTRDPPPSQHCAPKNPRGKRKTATQVAVAEYDAPSADNRAPSASESGDHSEPDSGDDVSNLPPSARAGQADVNPTRQASPALDLSASETEPLEGVDVAIEPQPDDVSADDADGASADDAVDVSAGNDSVSASVETAGIGSGAPEVETSAADVTGVSELERAADGAQTDGLVSGAELQTDGIPAGAERGVKETEGDTLRAASTPEGEKPEEALGGSSEEKTSGGRLPVVLTPETGSAAERASSPLRPRKLHFADIDAGREEAPVEKSVEQSSGGVRERSSNSLPKSLTPLCGGLGSESSGEFEIEGEVRARMSAKTDDVAVGSMGGDQNGQSQEDLTESESEEDAAASEPVESAKKQRKKDLLAKLKSLQEVKSQLRAREVYLAGILSQKAPGVPEGAPAAASDDVSGSEGAPAHDVSGAQPPAQAGVRSVSEAAAFDVSKNADGASAAETEGTGADPNDVTNLSPDGLKAMVTDFGGREVQPGGDFGQTAIQGREKEDGPAVKGNSVKILGVTVLEAGLTPELVTTNDPAASLSRPQSLQSLEASLVKTPEQPAAAGNGEGVNEGGSGAVLECLTPGTGGNESGSFSSDRAVEPESPASPPRKRARAGDVAALSAGDPSEPLAAQGAETIGECVLVESTPTQRAEQSLEGARAAENELQIGASPKGPQTPDQVEKARKPGEPLGQPSTRASLASRPDFQPGAPTAEPGTGVGQSTVREILPAILAGDPGGLAGQLGAGVGQLDAERSSRGSLGEGEMERGEKDPDRIVLELIRVARENEVRCRKMESRLREAEERARGAEERARGSEERARELEETARESERKSRDSEMRIRGAEERARLAEGLTRLAEARARLAEMLAGGAEERAQLAEEKARLAEESARAAEKRAWDNEMTGRALEKRLCESEAKGRELEERLRVSEGFARALEVMKRETEEHCAAEIVELKKTMKKDREDFCEAAGCLLWGKDGSDGSLTSADLIARGVVESVAALKELLEDLEGCPGQRTGGLIERARDQLLALRSDLERKQEEVGMLEMMLETRLDQREQLREGLERTREDGLETGGGVGGKDSQENTVSVGIEQATQTDGLRDGEPGQPLADAKSDRADVGGLRAELETIKQEYRELVSLFMRER